ncbi:MAG: LamG domain-containing protein [Planctomycetota bacterium]|jgi:hypothetical protein
MRKVNSKLVITIVLGVFFGNQVLAGNLADGLVAHWAFEEGQGDVVYDSSLYGNNGILQNEPIWIPGEIGDYALDFDGMDDCVEVPDDDSLDIAGHLTVSAWVKAKRTDKRQVIVAKNAYGANSWILEINQLDFDGTKFNFYVDLFGFDGNFGSNIEVTVDRWYHVVCTYNGSERRIYINGQLDADQTVSGAIPTNDQPVRIGGGGNMSRYFDGTIDNVRIYHRALSAGEVFELYTNDLNTTGRPVNLIIAIINIKNTIAEKFEVLEAIDASLEQEYWAYGALEELLASGDYGDLTKADIIKAKQKIHTAIQHQKQSLDALEKSIEKLKDALDALGVEPDGNGEAQG